MNVHIALYRWKLSASRESIANALKGIEELANKLPGIIDIMAGENTSKYGDGYTHVILVRGKDQAAIDSYRAHPDHARLASEIEAMEEHGIGVDFEAHVYPKGNIG